VDFSLSAEQVLLRDSVDRYVTEHGGVGRYRALRAQDPGYDPADWSRFAELGLLAVPFPAALGGFDGGAVELMVIAEALGRGLLRVPYLSTVVTCGGLLAACGDAAVRDRYLPDIIDGSALWAFAFAERGSDYDLANLDTRARRSADGYVLSGAKLAVLDADSADFLLVTAATAAGPALFIVDAAAEGVRRRDFVAVDGGRGADLAFDDVVLGADSLLGEAGDALALCEPVLDRARVAVGAEALGAMQALLDATVEYTKTRRQFGQPISNFQVLQHRMADMYMKVEETRSLLFNAIIQVDAAGAEAAAACAALQVKVAEAGRFVSQQAVQLHGGIGMTDELGVSHYYKRLLLLAALYGDEAYHLRRFAALSATA